MLKRNLFDLSDEKIALSKSMYSGKIIKCLVAPYHTYEQLETLIDYTPSTYLFPERDATIQQLSHLISMIVNSKDITEARIVTTNMNIIMDMIDDNVRVLTEDNRVVNSPCKTFMANIHTLRYELLENNAHQISDEQRQEGKEIINALIKEVNDAQEKGATKTAIRHMKVRAELIGEDIIRVKLLEMMRSITPSDGFDYEELKIMLNKAKMPNGSSTDKLLEECGKMFNEIPADTNAAIKKELKDMYRDALQNRLDQIS